MISNNDLYDITFALTNIRNDIENEENKNVLEKIILVLEQNEKGFEDNQIRNAIATINGLNKERWYYIYIDNVYVARHLVKDEKIYRLFVKLCEELRFLLESENYDRAYCLSDSFHCLPDIVANNALKVPKSFWKIYVKPYRDQWDETFLVTEQRFDKRERILALRTSIEKKITSESIRRRLR